jgi:hypothetical protein
MPEDINGLIIGVFNLIRYPENRNKPGGNLQEMFGFNDAIRRLRLVEIPLKGCIHTPINKQFNPLLERVDWFFTSNAWTTLCPNTLANALSRDTLDHTPCLISATTNIPKTHVFKFENYRCFTACPPRGIPEVVSFR